MSLLDESPEDMTPAERTLSSYLSIRLQQVMRADEVMKERIENITNEQNDLQARTKGFLDMVKDDYEAVEESGEPLDESTSEWIQDEADEITGTTNNLRERLRGAQTVVKQINSMKELYIGIAYAVDEDEMSMEEAHDEIITAEEKCEWIDPLEDYDLSSIVSPPEA